VNSANKNDKGGWNDLGSAYRQAAPYINVTYILISSIVLFGLIGFWVDKLTGMQPLFFILGLFLGLAAGFYSFFKTVQKLDKGQ
jgi:F0F1-type ATP synthase assembly protein I